LNVPTAEKEPPELYDLLHKAFRQDTASILKITKRSHTEIERMILVLAEAAKNSRSAV
jgi:hypothetical protein